MGRETLMFMPWKGCCRPNSFRAAMRTGISCSARVKPERHGVAHSGGDRRSGLGPLAGPLVPARRPSHSRRLALGDCGAQRASHRSAACRAGSRSPLRWSSCSGSPRARLSGVPAAAHCHPAIRGGDLQRSACHACRHGRPGGCPRRRASCTPRPRRPCPQPAPGSHTTRAGSGRGPWRCRRS